MALFDVSADHPGVGRELMTSFNRDPVLAQFTKKERQAEKEKKRKEEEKKRKEAMMAERKKGFSLLTGYTDPNIGKKTLLPGDVPFPLA